MRAALNDTAARSTASGELAAERAHADRLRADQPAPVETPAPPMALPPALLQAPEAAT